MKLVYLHQSTETCSLIQELFDTRPTFSLTVEFNRKRECITTYEDTAGSWDFDMEKRIRSLAASGRIEIIENSEPSEGTWKYYEVKHERGFTA